MDDAVDLCTDAQPFGRPAAVPVQVRQVDARLDGEHDAGDQPAAILGFHVVDVDAVPVDRRPQAVARAVEDARGVARLLDNVPGDVVHLVAVEGPPLGDGLSDGRDRGVPGLGRHAEDVRHRLGNLRATVGHPGDVREAIIGAGALPGPQIDEEHVAGPDGTVAFGSGRVVGHGCVAVHRYDGRVVRVHVPFREAGQDELLDVVFGEGAALGQGLGHVGEGRVLDGHAVGRGPAVALHLGRRQHGLDELHQVGAADDLAVGHFGDQLHCARVHLAHVGERAQGTVLHGDAGRAIPGRVHEGGQGLGQLPPAHVGVDLAGQVRIGLAKGLQLDRVDQPAGPSLGRNPQKPAAGAAFLQAGHIQRDGILAAEVVEQPAVQLVLLQVGLNGFQLAHCRLLP